MSYWQCTLVALRGIKANVMRSTLTMLGIVVGVGAVIAMVSVGRGASIQVAERIGSLGAELLIVVPGSTSSKGVHRGMGTRHTLVESDADAIISEVALARYVAPKVHGRAQIVRLNRNWSTAVSGVSNNYFNALDWDVSSGGFFSSEDEQEAAKVAVIGTTVAKRLFSDEAPLGQQIRIKSVPFIVIGVLEPKGQSAGGQDSDDNVYVPLLTAKQRLFGGRHRVARDALDAILIRVTNNAMLEDAAEHVRQLLTQRHRIQPGALADFKVVDMSSVQATYRDTARAMSLLLLAVASVSLIVGGISVMNIMLVSVAERTPEIGLRLALGARRRDIRAQFLIEALTLSVLGGLMGLTVGTTAAILMAELGNWPAVVGPETIALAVGFSTLVGIFFGIYPAHKASLLDPMEALRYE